MYKTTYFRWYKNNIIGGYCNFLASSAIIDRSKDRDSNYDLNLPCPVVGPNSPKEEVVS